MGRGRAKAKQTKVARELKYSSHETDFNALQRELSQGGGPTTTASRREADPLDSDVDLDDDEDEDEDERRAWN